MKQVLKKLGLLIPPLRRLHEERNRFAQEVMQLQAERNALIAQGNQLEADNRTFMQKVESLEKRMNKWVQSQLRPVGRRLHVVGFARSGTTILFQILNSSPDVFLFGELNLHVLRVWFNNDASSYGGSDFLESFVLRKKKELPILFKGTLPPIKKVGNLNPDEYLDEINRVFDYAGDKIAATDKMDFLERFLDEEELRGATMIYTLRRPSENLQSVLKKFPDLAPPEQWAQRIAETMILILRAFLRGNRSYLVFHSDISPSLINEFEDTLDIKIRVDPASIGKAFQDTKKGEVGFDFSGIKELDCVYENIFELFSSFDKRTLKKNCSIVSSNYEGVPRIIEDIKDFVGRIKV